MKRLSFAIILFGAVLAFLSVASALNDCTGDSQTILKLSGADNAHGAIWSDSVYSYKICYNEKFTDSYTGANPHACNSNSVLRLSGNTNAHAGSDYNVEVCFGDLTCRITNGAVQTGEVLIVSLSALTNAHLSSGNNYPYKVYCKPGTPAPTGDFGDLIWTDMQDTAITSSFVNRTVKLVANSGFAEGTEVIFDIVEKDLTAPTDIATLTGQIDAGGKAVVEWDITDEVMELAGEGTAEFVFTASANGKNKESDVLSVANVQGPNDAPTATIISPLDKGVYFVNESIKFEGLCEDLESSVDYNWKVLDGTGSPIFNDKIEPKFNVTFQTDGQKLITLRCVDKQLKSAEDRVSIIVLGSVSPYIDAPAQRAVILGKSVNYDGSSSFALSNSGFPSYIIKCLGGACPTETNGCPTDYNGNCPISIDPDGKFGIYDNLYFNWTFGPSEGEVKEGSGAKLGIKIYSTLGTNKIIRLALSANGQSENTFNEFDLIRANGCEDDNGLWWDSNLNQYHDPKLEPNICNIPRLTDPNGRACCPIGYECVDNRDGFICDPNACNVAYEEQGETFPIEKCDDYNKVTGNKTEQCRFDCNQAYRNSIDGKLVNIPSGKYIDYEGCWWDSEEEECGYHYNNLPINPGTGDNQQKAECVIKVLKEEKQGTQCITTRETKRLTSTGLIEDISECSFDCDGETKTICTTTAPCGRAAITLPFFEIFNLIIGLAIVATIYILYGIYKKK